MNTPQTSASVNPPGVVVVRGNVSGFAQHIEIGKHRFECDEPVRVGGTDTGPGPYELLLAALGSCTSMTLALYAKRKQWPLEDITVELRHFRIHAEDCADCDTKEEKIDRIKCEITLTGSLSEEQRARLLEIANKCPVHRTLTSEIRIDSQLK